MPNAAFLAVDWGTTNCRAWTVDADGRPLDHKQFPLGVSRLAKGEPERRFREEVRPALGAERLPAILAGMIGSTLGWTEAPYVDCPADAEALASGLVGVEAEGAPVRIVPGLRCRGIGDGPDVMRGEETQVFGWIAADPARARGLHILCHPGTHAKWVRIEDSRVTRFVTVMTGELFDVLSNHSVLRSADDAPEDDAAFADGVAGAGEGDALGARLFTARSRVVGGKMPAASARSYLSGLLIGSDVAAGPRLIDAPEDAPIALVGDARLCGLYAQALRARGRATETFAGEAAVLAGLTHLFHKADLS